MTPQEYQAWLKTLQGQKITPLWETVDAGQAESATPEGRQQAYILDPEGNKFILQQGTEQQAEAAYSTPTGNYQGSGLLGNYYGSEADGNAGAKGGTYMNFTTNPDGTLSASTDPRQVIGNDPSWWEMWRPIVQLAATAAGGYALGTARAGGGAAGWVSAEGGAGYSGGMAADSAAMADIGATGSDWSQGLATTNGSQGVYNTDAGMNALSEVGAGYEVPATVADSYGAGAANTAIAPITTPTPSPTPSPNTSVTPPVPNSSTSFDWSSLSRSLGVGVQDLVKILKTGVGGTNLASLLSSLWASQNQQNTANRLMDMYSRYNGDADYYGNRLRASYDNPQSWLQGADTQAVMNTTGDYLQRKDAAGGNLSNNIGRNVTLNNAMYGNLERYRGGLSSLYTGMAGISTGQGARSAVQASGDASNPLMTELTRIGSTGT